MRRNSRPLLFRVNPDVDIHFASVVLLLDASNQVNGSTPSDIDIKGHTPTWRYNAQCKTDKSKFGVSSLFFDGNQDRVSFADSDDWYPGTGDYTVEMWAYAHASSGTGDRVLIGQSNVYNGFYPFTMRKTNLTTQMSVSNGSSIYGGYTGHATASDRWVHYALVRSAGNLFTYVDGVRGITSTALSGINLLNSAGALAVGAYSDFDAVNYKWYGWIDQVRLTKGVARYIDPFIEVPTRAFPRR